MGKLIEVTERYILIALLLISVSFFGSNNSFAQVREIILATGEWYPYTSEMTEGHGAFTEIVSAVFEEMGLQPVYQFVPWKRAEKMVEAGEVFAAFPYIKNEKRQKIFDFSEIITFSTGRFFYRTQRFSEEVPYKILNDLKPYKIGAVRGYWYEPQLEKAQLDTYYVNSEKQIIQMLYMGRVDLAPLDELVGWHLIRQLFPLDTQSFKTLRKPLNQSGLHLLVSRNYQNARILTKQFNEALALIRQKGIYQKILNRHGGKDNF